MMELVTIIYCYDENKNEIHYSKTKKGEKYFCVDCESELIVKEGKQKVKHLAHKNTENCGGTGESIFHKHWKENFFKVGMFINVANKISEPDNVEILDVLNEISLSKRYNKNWDIEIIVDTLLVTEKGDIVVEIHYTNPKDWDKLKPYYDELNLLRVYEVTVGKSINSTLKWFCLGEDEEIKLQIKNEMLKEEEKRKELARLKLEKKKKKDKLIQEVAEELARKEKELLKNGTYKKLKVFFNFKTELVKINDNCYTLQCLSEIKPNQYEKVILQFDLNQLNCNESKLRNNFDVKYGIRYCYVTVKNNPYNDVVKYSEYLSTEYNKRLYAHLCNIK